MKQWIRIVNSRILYQDHHETSENQQQKMTATQWKNVKKLQASYVIAPADKAGNNYIFVCKKYYVSILCKEMGINYINNTWLAEGNAVYKPTGYMMEQLISSHDIMSAQLGVNLDEKNKTLPNIFAIPKLHKNPYKFRFIAGARKSSMKPLSLLLTKILKHLKQHFRNYCNAATFFGASMYWSIDSSLEALQQIKAQQAISSIKTADFSTLYTCLPHQLVKEEMWFLLQLLFKNARKKFLCVGY